MKKNIKFQYNLNSDDINKSIIEKLILKHSSIVKNRFKILENYYNGEQDILNRVIEDDKPNSKNVFNYCQYISDQSTAYFLGKPITYASKNKKMFDLLIENNKINNSELEDHKAGHKASVKGVSYWLCYADKDSNFRYKTVDTDSIIYILDNTVEEKVSLAIRYYKENSLLEDDKEEVTIIEVYTENKIFKYKLIKDDLHLIEEENHNFKEIPIIEIPNNRWHRGDFENVIDIQNALNNVKNDVANDLEYYSNCLLALEGVDDTDDEHIKKLEKRKGRTLFLPEGGKAAFITKNINNNVVEYYAKDLKEDLHLLASIPDLTKLNITGDMKATAIKSLFFGTEQVVAEKERFFKIALEKRIRLFFNHLNFKSIKDNFNWRDIEITFNRNIPVNLSEFGDSVVKLQGTLPKQMVLEELKKAGLDIDVERALELLKSEESNNIFDNSIPFSEGDINAEN